jgi:hypothetical protein
MKTIYAVTMWSGGMPAKKWQTFEKPELLPSGTGIRFVCRDTKLTVELIGSVSVEEYQSGKDEIEAIRERFPEESAETPPARSRRNDGNGIDRLF